MKYFLGSYYMFFFFMILYMILMKLVKLTLPTTHILPTMSSKNIFETRDNVTFSNLLSIFMLFAVVKCGGGESKIERV